MCHMKRKRGRINHWEPISREKRWRRRRDAEVKERRKKPKEHFWPFE